MAEPKTAIPASETPATERARLIPTASICNDDAVLCERCGKAEMYRMHAVWRCPACGFKTDCCGW